MYETAVLEGDLLSRNDRLLAHRALLTCHDLPSRGRVAITIGRTQRTMRSRRTVRRVARARVDRLADGPSNHHAKVFATDSRFSHK
jgi:hypothetical protein